MATKKKTSSSTTSKVKKVKSIWDNDGLLIGLDYKFNDYGQIDWKTMVLERQELLMPNKNWFFGKVAPENVPNSVEEIENPKEEQLALTLKATHWLLNSRGYTDISYNPISRCRDGNQDIAVYSCKITFRGNYETDFKDVSYEAIASASESNTDGKIGIKYIDSIAQNRALSRAVRGFLNVSIVADEEMSRETHNIDVDEDSNVKKLTVLESMWNKVGDGEFSSFVSHMKDQGIEIDSDKWEQINGKTMREAIGLMRKSV